MFIKMGNPITAVLIDTSAYYNRQCDFSGITSAMIPTFLRLLESNHIPILSHPILDNEIRKSIKESKIIERTQALCKSVKKCKGVLKATGFSPEEILNKVNPEKVEKSILETYEKFNSKFEMLQYVDAQEVFEDYFNTNPPFSATGSKKAEFPDAFVIKGLVRYCEKHPEVTILVVSDDPDWKNTLANNKQIEMVNTLKDAMVVLWQQFGDKTEFASQIWSIALPEIMDKIADIADCEAFGVDGIYSLEDIEVNEIHTTDIIGNITPLEFKENSVLIHASASLSVDGVAEYLDENRSMWDKEDQCYYFMAYTRMHFKDAYAEVECEVQLDFPADGSMKPIEIKNVRITNKWDICLDISDAEITEEDITDYGEDDWFMEQAEGLEGYYNH